MQFISIFLFSFFVFSASSLSVAHFRVYGYSEEKKPNFEDSLLGNARTGLKTFYPEVVELIIEYGTIFEKVGTGFFISSDLLSTAAHVVDEGPLYFKDVSTGRNVYTEVLGIDEKHDLALLRAVGYESKHFYSVGPLNQKKKDSISIVSCMDYEGCSSIILEGDFVIVPGFPHGFFNILGGIIKGIIVPSEFSRYMKGYKIRVDIVIKTGKQISTFEGTSGAPVLFESHLLGVAVVGNAVSDSEFIGFAPVEALRSLVRKSIDKEIFSPVTAHGISVEAKREIFTSLFDHYMNENK